MVSPLDSEHRRTDAYAGVAPGPSLSDEDRAATTARLLAQAAETDDELEAKRLQDEVVVLNMAVAQAITARYRGRGVPGDDLLQVAYMGLLKAARGFDPTVGREFLSYAIPTVKGEVKRYFRDLGWMVRPPRRIQELQAQVSAAMRELRQTLGRSPRPSEVAQFLEVPVEEVIESLGADGCFTPASLDQPVTDDSNATLGDFVPDVDEEMSAAEARVMLAPAVRELGERDQRILYLRFFKQMSQAQIAEDIGVTQMQVSRLLSRILAELRGRLD